MRDLRIHREMCRQLADVEPPAGAVDEEPARAVEVVQLSLVAALRVEDLDPVVLAVGYVDQALGIRGDVVRQVEAAGIGPGVAPREDVPPLGIVLVDAGVPVAVGDVEVSGVRAERHVRRLIEGLAPLEARRFVRVPDRQEQPPLGRELADRVLQVVGQPHRVVRADRDPVGPPHQSLTP